SRSAGVPWKDFKLSTCWFKRNQRRTRSGRSWACKCANGPPWRPTDFTALLSRLGTGSAVGADDVTSPELGGGRRGLAAPPDKRGVLENHREGAHLRIVACERGAVLDLQVQVRRERVPGVADGGDPLPAGDGLARAHQRA